MLPSIEQRLALELTCKPVQVAAAIALLDEGATVPFIARYRKEATGGLDDIQLRLLEERLRYLRELEDRRAAIVASITEQNKMTPELLDAVMHAEDKTRLEDLYLPYKQKRRTKAQIAIEAGLAPLADGLLANPDLNPEMEANKYLRDAFTTAEGNNPGVADIKAALDGARQILMERFAEDATLLQSLREYVQEHGIVESKVIEGKQDEGEKFADYFDYSETIATVPSHRALALLRGRREGILDVTLRLDTEAEKPKWDAPHNPCEGRIAARFGIKNQGRPADKWLGDTARWTWRVKSFMHLETELMGALRERSEQDAINVFATNLKALLLAAPAGQRATMGLDPGLRTGVKVAVVDATGKVVDTAVIYPHQPKNDWDGSLHTLGKLAAKHNVSLISIGNGTASRETDKLAGELIKGLAKSHPEHKLAKIVVSEAGASVYSASELAAKEFPELDVSLRGAVSIARRLQDPLAELVKIEPKAIGVGQYQHDVNQVKLARALDARVEDCVNAVGVDVNTASAALLARVAGLSASVAENVVKHRDANGPFANRKALLKVPRLGDKAFEQCAGFLRVPNGDNPLDTSAVHPEAYPVVERIIAQCGREVRHVMGDLGFLRSLKAEQYTDDKFGLPTVRDILKELEKPGRDPRPEFVAPSFAEGVEDVKDLRPGMILEGRVTNVAAFGAFVDIGVHQDGLVHVSALSHTFVKDPRDAVKAGDIVKVKVMEVDLPRQRIGLSMRLDDEPGQARGKPAGGDARPGPRDGRGPRPGGAPKPAPAPANSAFADALSRAIKR